MKLTKHDKQAFVRAVMDDVPFIDYDELAQAEAQEHLLTMAPEEIQRCFKAHPNYMKRCYVQMPGVLSNFFAAPTLNDNTRFDKKFNDKLELLSDKKRDQMRARSSLEDKVRQAIEQCSTLRQAKERLPEFEKYLPADRDKSGVSNLPTATHLIEDLTQAGWPKGVEK